MTSIRYPIHKQEREKSKFSYLHRENCATVITRNFTHLKDLAITTLPDNFTKFEILRSSSFPSTIYILFRYRYCFDTFRSSRQCEKKIISTMRKTFRHDRQIDNAYIRSVKDKLTYSGISFTFGFASYSSYVKRKTYRTMLSYVKRK